MVDQTLKFIAEWQDKGLKKGAQDSAKAVENVDKKTVNLNKTLLSAAAVAGTVAAALKQAYDIGKQGAQLELTALQFDRLAISIGTTGDALRDDLGDATVGLLSNAEQMQLATELMSLGLVKTHDQAVRLTAVASQLGMNMNQLTLTLSNRTTMRFDSLGVAVDGFKERLKELENQGLSTEDAFTEAFLQQAENQIEKVGSVADTSMGSFMRFEAATENLSNSLKTSLLPIALNVVEGFTMMATWGNEVNKMLEGAQSNVLMTSESYEEYFYRMVAAAEAAGKLNYAEGRLLERQFESGKLNAELAKKYNIVAESEFEVARGIEIANSHFEYSNMLMGSSTGIIEDVADANHEYAGAIGNIVSGLEAAVQAEKDRIKWASSGGPQILAAIEKINAGYESQFEKIDQVNSLMFDYGMSLEDVNNMTLEEIEQEFEDLGLEINSAKGYAAQVYNYIQAIDGASASAFIDVYIKTHGTVPKGLGGSSSGVTTSTTTSSAKRQEVEAMNTQAGTNMVVPQWFTGDTAPVDATAGERVQVTTASNTRDDEISRRMERRQSNIELSDMIAQKIAMLIQ